MNIHNIGFPVSKQNLPGFMEKLRGVISEALIDGGRGIALWPEEVIAYTLPADDPEREVLFQKAKQRKADFPEYLYWDDEYMINFWSASQFGDKYFALELPATPWNECSEFPIRLAGLLFEDEYVMGYDYTGIVGVQQSHRILVAYDGAIVISLEEDTVPISASATQSELRVVLECHCMEAIQFFDDLVLKLWVLIPENSSFDKRLQYSQSIDSWVETQLDPVFLT